LAGHQGGAGGAPDGTGRGDGGVALEVAVDGGASLAIQAPEVGGLVAGGAPSAIGALVAVVEAGLAGESHTASVVAGRANIVAGVVGGQEVRRCSFTPVLLDDEVDEVEGVEGVVAGDCDTGLGCDADVPRNERLISELEALYAANRVVVSGDTARVYEGHATVVCSADSADGYFSGDVVDFSKVDCYFRIGYLIYYRIDYIAACDDSLTCGGTYPGES
jgi:hypothetical protein